MKPEIVSVGGRLPGVFAASGGLEAELPVTEVLGEHVSAARTSKRKQDSNVTTIRRASVGINSAGTRARFSTARHFPPWKVLVSSVCPFLPNTDGQHSNGRELSGLNSAPSAASSSRGSDSPRYARCLESFAVLQGIQADFWSQTLGRKRAGVKRRRAASKAPPDCLVHLLAYGETAAVWNQAPPAPRRA